MAQNLLLECSRRARQQSVLVTVIHALDRQYPRAQLFMAVSRHILVLDDSLRLAKMVASYLQHNGFEMRRLGMCTVA